jgi:hypothetical protein
LERFGTEPILLTGVRLPEEVEARLFWPKGNRLRFKGTVNGYPLEGAWGPAEGAHFAILGQDFRRKALLTETSLVDVEFEIVDAEVVDLPEDVAVALGKDEFNAFKWDCLTPGIKRGFLHQINQAKTLETRSKRIAKLMAKLSAHMPGEPLNRTL